jgi:membrane protein implicated in regulation of membrane protease activity
VLAVSAWLARVGRWLKSVPWLLLAVAGALALLRSARRHEQQSHALERRSDVDLQQLGSAEQRAAYIEDQKSAVNRAVEHYWAAVEARQRANKAAKAIESAGHPSVAELVRRWNRESSQ